MRQTKKTAFITGANSGIGYELTKKLINEDMDVIALIRSRFPSEDKHLGEAIKHKNLRIYYGDISDYSALKSALDKIKESEPRIDVLFNNAGIGLGELVYSRQGREMHFEVNTVVPYIIMKELKLLLTNGADKTIINVSSNALLTVKEFDLNTLEKPTQFKKLFGSYAQSKLALSLWTKEITRNF